MFVYMLIINSHPDDLENGIKFALIDDAYGLMIIAIEIKHQLANMMNMCWCQLVIYWFISFVVHVI